MREATWPVRVVLRAPGVSRGQREQRGQREFLGVAARRAQRGLRVRPERVAQPAVRAPRECQVAAAAECR
jgi:hypothetical protein